MGSLIAIIVINFDIVLFIVVVRWYAVIVFTIISRSSCGTNMPDPRMVARPCACTDIRLRLPTVVQQSTVVGQATVVSFVEQPTVVGQATEVDHFV